MPRPINLRQVEAFKAVVETGTVSHAADLLNISQPAMSKLIAQLESDTGLILFERVKGRLAPTENAMRLHDEVSRVFADVRQIESAVDAIHREEQGRLAIGVMPALAASFIQRATSDFLKKRKSIFCMVHTMRSEWIVDFAVSRKIDIGLIRDRLDNPYLDFEPLLEHPLVCIMPLDHDLTQREEITPRDLDDIHFVAFHPTDSHAGYVVERMFERYHVRRNIVLIANASPTICEFVAAGLGVSLVHPLMASGLEHRLAVRRFTPDIPYSFQLCRSTESRNAKLVDDFIVNLRKTAKEISEDLLGAAPNRGHKNSETP